MVIAVCGKPGTGKTLFTTYILKKQFKQENNFIIRNFKKDKIFNNCFANYPVQLDKNNISKSIGLLDLNDIHDWLMDSVIVFDEIQAYFDSLDYKKIPRTIARNFQFHRHFGIKDIYIVSQDPSRIPKVFRVLAQEWYQIKSHIKIPLIGIAFFKVIIWNREEDYNQPCNLTRKQKQTINYDYKKKYIFFKYKKVYKSYNTKYMNALSKGRPIFDKGSYNSLFLTQEEIINNFPSINN